MHKRHTPMRKKTSNYANENGKTTTVIFTVCLVAFLMERVCDRGEFIELNVTREYVFRMMKIQHQLYFVLTPMILYAM